VRPNVSWAGLITALTNTTAENDCHRIFDDNLNEKFPIVIFWQTYYSDYKSSAGDFISRLTYVTALPLPWKSHNTKIHKFSCKHRLVRRINNIKQHFQLNNASTRLWLEVTHTSCTTPSATPEQGCPFLTLQ